MPRLDRRRMARLAACQAAYMLEANPGGSLADALEEVGQLERQEGSDVADPSLIEFFVGAHARHRREAESRLEQVMNTPLSDARPLERAMLLLAALEMGWRPGTPAAVVINEWLEVSRQLASEQSHSYLNAILEQLRASAAWRDDEREVVERFFRPAAGPGDGVVVGIGDDAAVIAVADGRMAISSDILIAGVHFDESCDPGLLGRKALAANLSDLAAMAARPQWAILSLALPEIDEDWLRKFSAGWKGMAQEHGVRLLGGDLSGGPSLAVSVTVGGIPVGEPLRLDTARAGDDLWVSGTLGEAACDFAETGGLGDEGSSRLLNPQPRLQLGEGLAAIASAATDLSDGLLKGVRLLAGQSGAGACVQWQLVPLADRLAGQDDPARQLELGACWGEDYELLFSAGSEKRQEIERLAGQVNLKVSRIGEVTEQQQVRFVHPDRGEMSLPAAAGHCHFGKDAAAAAFAAVGRIARKRGIRVAVAESCTAGLLAAGLARLPGASDFFAGGITAYLPAVKQQLLGVAPETIEGEGVVSQQVALQMAAGAAERVGAEAAAAVTCWAGPDGGDGQRPGTVCIAACCAGVSQSQSLLCRGGRERIRQQAAAAAARLLAQVIRRAGG